MFDVSLPYLKIPLVKRTENLQVALSSDETRLVLAHLSGEEYLIAASMYGSGLRVNEACSLWVKDIDLAHAKIVVRESKGGDHRVTILPEALINE